MEKNRMSICGNVIHNSEKVSVSIQPPSSYYHMIKRDKSELGQKLERIINLVKSQRSSIKEEVRSLLKSDQNPLYLFLEEGNVLSKQEIFKEITDYLKANVPEFNAELEIMSREQKYKRDKEDKLEYANELGKAIGRNTPRTQIMVNRKNQNFSYNSHSDWSYSMGNSYNSNDSSATESDSETSDWSGNGGGFSGGGASGSF